MIQESSPRRTADLQDRLRLLREASEGKLDGLSCPECGCREISVSFSVFERDYRTWFECSNCGFSMRAQNSGKPPFFCEERLRLDANRAPLRRSTRLLPVTLRHDEDGVWVVECPAIPGCVSQGATREEALTNIKDAIAGCLVVRAEKGMPLTVETEMIEVGV